MDSDLIIDMRRSLNVFVVVEKDRFRKLTTLKYIDFQIEDVCGVCFKMWMKLVFRTVFDKEIEKSYSLCHCMEIIPINAR